MNDKVLTLEEIEERLDEITNQPEKYVRDQKGNLIEANTSVVKAVGTTAFITEEQNVDLNYRSSKMAQPVRKDLYKIANIGDPLRAVQGSFWVDQNPQKERNPDTNNLIFLGLSKI